jgi:hypothetical protein
MHQAHHRSYTHTLGGFQETEDSYNSPWDYTNDTAPAKPYTTAVEQAHIKSVSPALDLRQDLPIMLRYAWW